MAIPLDTYISVAPETDFLATGYLSLTGSDVFIYVSDTNELRSVVLGETTFYTLAIGVSWCSVVQVGTTGHIYYIDLNGGVHYLEYDRPGPPIKNSVSITGVPLAVTISVLFQPNSTPPVWVIMVDDGQQHHISTAAANDPAFQTILQSEIVYNNLIDQTYYTNLPSIAIHPGDSARMTVCVQQEIIANGRLQVGFYVATIPGVV